MAHLREIAETDSRIQEAWSECLRGPMEHMGQGFGRCVLKGKPFLVVPNATDEDVQVLINALKKTAPDYDPNLRTQADLRKMPLFAARLLKGTGQQTCYLTEVAGVLDRVPQELRYHFAHPFPMPLIDKKIDPDHHLSYAETRALQQKGLIISERYRPSNSSKKSGRASR